MSQPFDLNDPRFRIDPVRLAELQAMERCPVCRSLVKVCGGCKEVG